MTALPEPVRRLAIAAPRRPLTIADYVALDEDDQFHAELQEGALVMTPSPEPEHNLIGLELAVQVRAQLPPELIAVPDVDIDLQLEPADGPATVRRPDLVVVRQIELDRRKSEGGVLRASNVVVVVEIVSPGSRRMDYHTKRDEYADAGIPHYWIIDSTAPMSLLALSLTEELGYVDNGEVTGTFTTTSPCPLTIELDKLG
ncbi:Uma2 family endonuclease [Nocardia sp. NPDC052112]|uniref:Uma2 family endonuclease n=1 Tax=Nocardia sp. NPDC052112 TaxID=3155646 RepID=UPI003419FEDF